MGEPYLTPPVSLNVNPDANTSVTMADFRPRAPDVQGQVNFSVAPMPVTTRLEYITAGPADEPDFGIRSYKAARMNVELAMSFDVANIAQKAAHLFGVLLNIIPGMKFEIYDCFSKSGLQLVEIPLTEAAANALIVPNEPMDVRKACVIFGFVSLILFKNVTDENFDEFSNRRLRAITSQIGHPEGDRSVRVFGGLNIARRFKEVFGGVWGVKRIVLQAVLEQRGNASALSVVCAYVARIVEWTDMSGLVFINQALLLPNSPVLLHPRVVLEVVALYDALRRVLRSPSPQYFRINCTPEEYRILDRNNFPHLMSVAQKIRLGDSPTVRRFIDRNQENPLVTELFNLHNNHYTARRRMNVQHIVQFLTHHDQGTPVEQTETVPANRIAENQP